MVAPCCTVCCRARLAIDTGCATSRSPPAREFSDAFWRQLIDLSSDDGKQESPRDRLLLPGITDPSQSASLTSVWKILAQMFRGIEAESGHDVLIDLGRRGAYGPSGVLAEQADATFVVVRNTLRCLQAAEGQVHALEERVGGVSVLMINEGPIPRVKCSVFCRCR